MKTVAIINQKGGVGKSTTAHALGAGLILKGYRTLFIDLDPQGNLSFIMGASTRNITIAEVLMQSSSAPYAIQHTEQGDVIASSPTLTGADATLSATGKEYRLKEALARVKDSYDFCIIDTPPALGILAINALTACNEAIIPAQADIFSLQGISQLHDTIEAVKRYCNPALTINGIVLTRYSPRAIISREVTELLEQTASRLSTKLYKARIREGTAIKEAQAMRQSIYIYAPKSNASADYTGFVDEFLQGNEPPIAKELNEKGES